MHPSFLDVARRPRWIGALLFALAVAAIFAALGQWQIGRAVEQGQADERDTETPVALDSVAEPQQPLTAEAGGRMIETTATIDPDSFLTIVGRDQDGTSGAWLTARAITDAGDSLAVAIGWAPTRAEAEAAIDDVDLDPTTIVGRYLPSESPTVTDFEQDTTEAMAVGDLINRWPGFDGDVYSGYVVLDAAPASLATIVSLPPQQQTQLNWLNVFYAIEWVAFALFAFYLWFRLVQDAREREREAAEDAAAEPAPEQPAAT
ncbi:SURF1 family cytochrome oxidase biogenesis protein [Agrococcus jejuensis]|uniref:SURF1-like protein n=1 Tax=Agrococcus jejuensis TaxID=399736 RepID=A0A1G8BGU3_9MICO|nr:SURF1 family cytochrome oxidase biogenesis protein [Agrococcus jejuensis]SDH32419.1 Cytochrome oxidase assembly protein ShyY1 [Agrococcus jejuensis]